MQKSKRKKNPVINNLEIYNREIYVHDNNFKLKYLDFPVSLSLIILQIDIGFDHPRPYLITL